MDQLTSGLTIRCSEVNLKSVIVSASSSVVYAKAIYTLTIQSSYNIPASSTIRVKFPQQLTDGGQSLQSFAINGVNIGGCGISISNSSYM